MPFLTKIYTLLGVFAISIGFSFAQPVANFTADPVAGCIGDPISFINTSDLSACSGDVTWNWTAGNGQTSTLENPDFTYMAAGDYEVTLQVTCNGLSDTYVSSINILPSPVPSFTSVSYIGCAPYTVSFENTTNDNGALVVDWYWNFGDGYSSTEENPTHTYENNLGTFSIQLRAENANGCNANYELEDAIRVSSPPGISISAIPASHCETPFNVSFDADIQTNPPGMEYTTNWNFGDSGTASENDDQTNHTYYSDGSYDVSLSVTDAFGCPNEVEYPDMIRIEPIVPSHTIFTQQGNTMEENTTGIVCLGRNVLFQNNNHDYANISWIINGTSYSSSTPVMAFNTPGTVTVEMIVDAGGECETHDWFTLQVEDPTPSFTTNPYPPFSCTSPFTVDFTSNTYGVDVTDYYWVFDDGGTSIEVNPSHTYYGFDTLVPRLVVTTENGCIGQYLGEPVIIHEPTAYFELDTDGICIGSEVNANFVFGTDSADIVSYVWDFGDGSPEVENDLNVSHVYNEVGNYGLTLTVTDIHGCENSYTDIVQAGDHQTPLFDTTGYPTEVCPFDTLDFYSLSTDPAEIDAYYWGFSGAWEGGAGVQLDNHTFHQDTGWVSVIHTTLSNGCQDQYAVPNLFHVNGPIIEKITADHECEMGYEYHFNVDLFAATAWTWWITDAANDTISSLLNVTDSSFVYEFPGDGFYTIHVSAINNDTDLACEYELDTSIFISHPQAYFSLFDDTKCPGEEVFFDGGFSSNAISYYWDFGNGTNSGWMNIPDTSAIYFDVGDTPVSLTVQDANGCENTYIDTLHIFGPDIALDNENVIACTPYDFDLSGTVTAPENVLEIYIEVYNGDDVVIDTVMDVSDLGQNTVPFAVSDSLLDAGSYDVYIGASISSCPTGELMPFENLVNLTSIDAAFSTSVGGACINEDIMFNAEEDNPDYEYSWDFGNGVTSNEQDPVYQYPSEGLFVVSLEIVDPISGCVSVDTIEESLDILDALALFSVPDYYPCPDTVLQIENLSVGDSTDFVWYYDGNSYHMFDAPEIYIGRPGLYVITLVEENEYCSSVQNTVEIQVDGPDGDFTISAEEVCFHDSIQFTAFNLTPDVDSLVWTFGDGGSSNEQITWHAFDSLPEDGSFLVNISLYGDECKTIDGVSIPVHDVISDFSVSADFMCSPMFLDLDNNSTGDNLLYEWTIEGLGHVYDDTDVAGLILQNTGLVDSVVDIQLIAHRNSEYACPDTSQKQVIIGSLPRPNITPATIICDGSNIGLHAEGGREENGYNWYPEIYLSDPHVSDPLAEPLDDVTYYLTVTGENTCVANDSVTILLQRENLSSLFPLIDTIFIGESTTALLTNEQASTIIEWTPDIASISCLDCNNPILNPLENTTYYVCVSDSLKCFTECDSIYIVVDETFTLDMPSAFTPEGYQPNSVVYARGIGIMELLEFSIYNRWGEKLFTTDDINQGWDGYYKGKLQPVDTYVYYVKVLYYDGRTESKKGHILLVQ